MLRIIVSLLLYVAIACPPLATLAAPVEASAKNFLWLVKSKTGAAYLYGTMHVGKESFYPLPITVETAFKKSAKLVVEADIRQSDMAAILPFVTYAPPDVMDTHVTKAVLDRLKTQLERYGLPYENIRQFKPSMVSGLLVVAELGRFGYDQRFGMDRYLLDKAGQSDKPIVELESVEQQARLLGMLSDAEQEAFLSNSIADLEDGKAVAEVTGMLDALRIGDTRQLEEVVQQTNKGIPESLLEKLLYQRNTAMLPKIEGFLAAKETHFIAVGAMHMVGPRGLVEMLKAKGYVVKQL